MAPVQNTFSIIPNFPSAANNDDDSVTKASRRPMTTKQAKKAYQKANKGPKLSKAEQRRQELLEQDRIRKEAEKERNQARARAARDRKKDKEENERAEKKKKGLPLVNVRPSQDTIARFVRGFGAPKTRPQPPETASSVCSPVFEVAVALENRDNPCSPPSSPASKAEEPRSDREVEDEPSPKRQRVGEPAATSLSFDHDSENRLLKPSPEKRTRVSPSPGSPNSRPQHNEPDDSEAPRIGSCHEDTNSKGSPMPPHDISDSKTRTQPGAVAGDTQSLPQDEKIPTQTPPQPVTSITAPISFSQELRDIADILDDNYLNDSFGSIFASPGVKEKSTGPSVSPFSKSIRQLGQAQSAEQETALVPKEVEATRAYGEPGLKPQGPLQRPFDVRCQPDRPLMNKKTKLNCRKPLQPLPVTVIDAKSNIGISGRNERLQHMPFKLDAKPAQPQKPPSMQSMTPMGPPPIPSKTSMHRQEVKHPRLSTDDAKKLSPNFTKQKQVPTERESQEISAPLSTQAFVLSHLDELFPSPSQEIEELYAVDKSRNRKAVNAPRFLKTNQPLQHHTPPRFLSKGQSGSTMKPPTQLKPQNKAGAQQQRDARSGTSKQSAALVSDHPSTSDRFGRQVQITDEFLDFPFLSTQDVFLSSQDVQEMETPTNSFRKNRSADLLPSSSSQRSATPTPAFRSGARGTRHKNLQNSPNTMGSSRAATRVSDRIDLELSAKIMDVTKGPLALDTKQSSTVARSDLSKQYSERPFGKPSYLGSKQSPEKVTAPILQEEKCQTTPRVTDQSTAAPRARAEPFFTSSCRAPLYKYAIERNKTSAWGDKGFRKDAEAGLDLLQQLENERFVNLLDDTEPLTFEENDHAFLALTAESGQQNSFQHGAEQNQEGTPRQIVTKVFNLPTNVPHSSTQSAVKRADWPYSSVQQQQTRPLSSYEKMLAELDKTKQNKNSETHTGKALGRGEGQDNSDFGIHASQETDYGDMDDEMLSMMC